MTPLVAGIMPCLGRVAQTLSVIERLFLTADYSDWRLVCVVDDNSTQLAQTLSDFADGYCAEHDWGVSVLLNSKRLGYWRSMSTGAKYAHDAMLLVNLANDLLAGRSWLARSVALAQQSGAADKVIGYNDAYHQGETAAHFLAPRSLLRLWYGDDLYPTMYSHNFGDTELIERAKRLRAFVSAPYAVLYHNHPVNGAQFDSVYELGLANYKQDESLYHARIAATV